MIDHHILSAYWKDLIMFNYSIEPSLLIDLIPNGTELDLIEGKAYVSLIGFSFTDTKIRNLPIPLHQNFEEINLRTYIKYHDGNKWIRGVYFLHQICSKNAVCLIANQLMNEHYRCHSTNKITDYNADNFIIGYSTLKHFTHSFSVIAEHKIMNIDASTLDGQLAHQYIGFSKNGDSTYFHEVQHNEWKFHQVIDYDCDIDFKILFGDRYKILNQQEPESVLLIEGGNIKVYPNEKIN